jgi:dUTP pyrophosphatase
MNIKVYTEDDKLLPIKGTGGSACYDLRANDDYVVFPKTTEMINTGLIIEPPKGYFIKLYVRSSISLRGLVLANGTGIIDNDYRDPIKMIIYNLSEYRQNISKYDRIGQMELVKQVDYEIEKVDTFECLSCTEREGGFGSTGI